MLKLALRAVGAEFVRSQRRLQSHSCCRWEPEGTNCTQRPSQRVQQEQGQQGSCSTGRTRSLAGAPHRLNSWAAVERTPRHWQAAEEHRLMRPAAAAAAVEERRASEPMSSEHSCHRSWLLAAVRWFHRLEWTRTGSRHSRCLPSEEEEHTHSWRLAEERRKTSEQREQAGSRTMTVAAPADAAVVAGTAVAAEAEAAADSLAVAAGMVAAVAVAAAGMIWEVKRVCASVSSVCSLSSGCWLLRVWVTWIVRASVSDCGCGDAAGEASVTGAAAAAGIDSHHHRRRRNWRQDHQEPRRHCSKCWLHPGRLEHQVRRWTMFASRWQTAAAGMAAVEDVIAVDAAVDMAAAVVADDILLLLLLV